MPTLVRWYERRAKDCVQSAGRTDNLRHREHLLRLAARRGLVEDGPGRSPSSPPACRHFGRAFQNAQRAAVSWQAHN